jgi:hypothetical protein
VIEARATDVACLLAVSIVDRPRNGDAGPGIDPMLAAGWIEIDNAGGRRLSIGRIHDPNALAGAIRHPAWAVSCR